MSNREDYRIIVSWLNDLAGLVAGTQSEAAVKDRFGSYVGLLADEFPRDAFTRQSLAEVARQCKFFPAYGELCSFLSAWWRDARPLIVALPVPRPEYPAEPTEAEKLAASLSVKRAISYLELPPEQRPRPRPSHLSGEALRRARASVGAAP